MALRLIALAAAVVLLAPAALYGQGRGGPEWPAGDGKELAQRVCTSCHDGTAVLMKRDGENGWRANVERMVVQKAAQLFPDEMETVVKYLSTRLGPGVGGMETTGVLPPDALGSGQPAKAVQLPEGPGKDLVQARCTLCHDLGRVVSVHRTNAEWQQLTKNMTSRGPQAPPAQVEAIVTYLTTHFRK